MISSAPHLPMHHHAGDDHRPAERIGDHAHLRAAAPWGTTRGTLDLAERDALAVDLDQLVLAARQEDAPRLVEVAEVAGAQPALCRRGRRPATLAVAARALRRADRAARAPPCCAPRSAPPRRSADLRRRRRAPRRRRSPCRPSRRRRPFLSTAISAGLGGVVDGHDADAPAVLERLRRRLGQRASRPTGSARA